MRLCSGLMRLVLVGVTTIALSSCVAPAFNLSQYQSKVAKTADEAASALETAHLAADSAVRHGLYRSPIEVSLSDSEDILGAIRGTFASVQPPGPVADTLRNELLDLLDRAGSAVERARIEFRRGEELVALTSLERARPVVLKLRALAERF